jgi:hypothetical protein
MRFGTKKKRLRERSVDPFERFWADKKKEIKEALRPVFMAGWCSYGWNLPGKVKVKP